ncbi:MAG: ABC transporter permease subunit [Actinomycetota bacterium]|nr:ABC transporter permease subunit [Actinomycetota bacterium]
MTTLLRETTVPAPPATAATGPRHRARMTAALAPVILGLVLVAIWWAAAILRDSAVLPDPVSAVDRLTVNLGDERFQTNLIDTVVRLVVAYCLVVVLGATIGFTVGLSRFWSDVVSPIAYAIYSIPKIVLFPLFLVFLGLGASSQIGFAVFSGVLPMFLMVMSATAGVPRLQLKLAASLQMGTVGVVRKIVLPSCLPAFASALRLSFGLTFLGLIIAEMFSGVSGLGYEILRNVPLARMGDIVGDVLVVIVLALGPATALRILEKRIHRRFGGSA